MQDHGKVWTCDLHCLDAVVFVFNGKDNGKSCGGDGMNHYTTRPAQFMTDFLRSQVYLQVEVWILEMEETHGRSRGNAVSGGRWRQKDRIFHYLSRQTHFPKVDVYQR